MKRLNYLENKIQSLEYLKKQSHIWKFKKDKIVFTNGCFDILHRGHLEYLAAASDLGDRLIVGLNSDESVRRLKGEGRPVNTSNDRALALASLAVVDAVCVFDEDTPLNLIEALNPNVLVKGGDYNANDVIGADFINKSGGKVAILDFTEGYSTTRFLQKLKD